MSDIEHIVNWKCPHRTMNIMSIESVLLGITNCSFSLFATFFHFFQHKGASINCSFYFTAISTTLLPFYFSNDDPPTRMTQTTKQRRNVQFLFIITRFTNLTCEYKYEH